VLFKTPSVWTTTLNRSRPHVAQARPRLLPEAASATGGYFLLVEVSDTTLTTDREDKLPAYGHAGIGEVWIVNLADLTVEVYREPHFTGYGAKTVLRAGDKATPQAFPDVAVDVAELLKS